METRTNNLAMTVVVEELHPAGGVRTGDLSVAYRRRRVIRSPWMPVRGSAMARSIGGKEEDAGDGQWLENGGVGVALPVSKELTTNGGV